MDRARTYLLLAVVGAVVPYVFFVDHFLAHGVDVVGFVAALFESGAAGGFTADLLIASPVFWLFMARDAREREVFGKIRFMNYNGCKRKFNVAGFVARYKSEVAAITTAMTARSMWGRLPSIRQPANHQPIRLISKATHQLATIKMSMRQTPTSTKVMQPRLQTIPLVARFRTPLIVPSMATMNQSTFSSNMVILPIPRTMVAHQASRIRKIIPAPLPHPR